SVIEQFIGKTGTRTIFSIEAINAKFIREHAYFKEEDEIVLTPGTYLKVIDKMQPAKDLTIIHLREVIPPFPLVASPFDDNNEEEEQILINSTNPTESTVTSLAKTIYESILFK
ncbi:unnamed protein product, partial [Adineta steineri]